MTNGESGRVVTSALAQCFGEPVPTDITVKPIKGPSNSFLENVKQALAGFQSSEIRRLQMATQQSIGAGPQGRRAA
eukprot:1776046-Pyramimonas_sp.AAC.1